MERDLIICGQITEDIKKTDIDAVVPKLAFVRISVFTSCATPAIQTPFPLFKDIVLELLSSLRGTGQFEYCIIFHIQAK